MLFISTLLPLLLLLTHAPSSLCKLREGDCDVCIQFLGQLSEAASSEGISGQDAMKTFLFGKCKKAKEKENRFCYYIGATEDAPTGIVMEIVRPLLSSVPPEKICEKLKKMDEQICELKYDKKIDFKNTDLSKLRIRELRKILSGWGESCPGCVEKPDFVERVKLLLPRHEEL